MLRLLPFLVIRTSFPFSYVSHSVLYIYFSTSHFSCLYHSTAFSLRLSFTFLVFSYTLLSPQTFPLLSFYYPLFSLLKHFSCFCSLRLMHRRYFQVSSCMNLVQAGRHEGKASNLNITTLAHHMNPYIHARTLRIRAITTIITITQELTKLITPKTKPQNRVSSIYLLLFSLLQNKLKTPRFSVALLAYIFQNS